MKQKKILLTKGDGFLFQQIKKSLETKGIEVISSPDSSDSFHDFLTKRPDLLLIASSGKDVENELKLSSRIRQRNIRFPIFLVTRQSSEDFAIAALKAGVNDYFKPPYSGDTVARRILTTLGRRGEKKDQTPHEGGHMVTASKSMQEIKKVLTHIAATECTVLITGETGTGKELAAEWIHRESGRREKPFVCLNCAALPESLIESEMFGYERGAFTGAVSLSRGKFEQANGGTIFLDEIADMSPHAQAKILRTIERKEVYRLGGTKVIPLNMRITAATNKDPERLIDEGNFRNDLYYRLNVARVHLPPLRERKEDIQRLVAHMIRKLNLRFDRNVEGLTGEAMESLIRYNWPGNVRELINLLEATFVNLPSRKIDFADLPKVFQQKLERTEGLPENERDRLLSALLTTNWNKSKAARKLHWSRMTLYRKMAKYCITSKPPSEK